MHTINPNVIKTIDEFKGYLSELNNNPDNGRLKHIGKEFVVCEQLINYSCEVMGKSDEVSQMIDIVCRVGRVTAELMSKRNIS